MKHPLSSQRGADFGTGAYHGYWIGSTISGDIFIEKDNQLIGWAPSVTAAKLTIDRLATVEGR